MEVLIDTYGAKVYIKNRLIVIKAKDYKKEISPYKVNKIIIGLSVSISTDVIYSCITHKIDLVFLDKFKFPFSRLWNNKFGSIATIRENQLKFFKSVEALKLIILWQIEKLNKMKEMCTFDLYKKEIKSNINNLKNIDINLGYLNVRKEIYRYEALATKIYYKYLNCILNNKYKFDKREKRGTLNKFNAVLNYSFGILYNNLEKEIIESGLDPSVGILHISNYNKIPFVYDYIEKYRYISFESVIKMLSEKEFLEEEFEVNNNKLTLGKEIRKQISIYFNEIYDVDKIKIKKEIKKMAMCILKENYEKLYNKL